MHWILFHFVPFTGNAIITGDKGTGALTIAQNIALDMRSNDSFTGNTETLTAEELDQKDITTLFEKQQMVRSLSTMQGISSSLYARVC